MCVCMCVCVFVSVRTIPFERNDLRTIGIYHLDPRQVKFDGQGQDHRSKFIVTAGKNNGRKTFSGVRARCEARQRDGLLKSRPQFAAVIKSNSGRYFLSVEFFVLKWSVRPRVRAF